MIRVIPTVRIPRDKEVVLGAGGFGFCQKYIIYLVI